MLSRLSAVRFAALPVLLRSHGYSCVSGCKFATWRENEAVRYFVSYLRLLCAMLLSSLQVLYILCRVPSKTLIIQLGGNAVVSLQSFSDPQRAWNH